MKSLDAYCDTYGVMLLLRRYWLPTAIILIATLALTYLGLGFVPRTFEASATILVEPRQSNDFGAPTGIIDAPRIASLVEVLRSRDTMALVVDQQGLEQIEEFGGQDGGARAREEAIARLADQVTVRAGTANAMIYIRGRAGSAELAQRITLAVAEAGLHRRAAMISQDIDQAKIWLEGAVAELRLSVEKADLAVADYMARHGYVSDPPPGRLEELSMAALSERIQAIREHSLLNASRAKLWREWQVTGDPALTGILADGRDQGLLQDYAAAQAELASLASRFGADHPVLRAAREHSAQLQNQIDATIEAIIDDAEAQATASDALIARLEADRDRARTGLVTQIGDSPDLEALRREADAQRQVLEDYLARYEATMTFDGPQSILPDMRIVAHPMVPAGPSGPRKDLILGATAIVLAMVVIAAAIVALQSGRRPLTA